MFDGSSRVDDDESELMMLTHELIWLMESTGFVLHPRRSEAFCYALAIFAVERRR